jgi:hexulose-6-phosphate isomerase
MPLVDNSSLNRISNKKKIINTLKGFENILIRNKMKFLFELDLSPSLARKFIKNFSKRAFGINYDTGNSASYGYAVKDEFSSYGKYIENIHIKDRKLNGFSVPLGQGDVNFSEFFKILKKYKYDNLLILQTARSNKNRDFNEIKRNLTFLKKKFK